MTSTTRVATITRNLDIVPAVSGGFVIAVVVEVAQDKRSYHTKTDVYHVTRIPCDLDGSAYEVTKQEPAAEPYHVHLSREHGDGCTCAGATYRSNCRHLDLVRQGVHERKL
jgi:hypothetical protein